MTTTATKQGEGPYKAVGTLITDPHGGIIDMCKYENTHDPLFWEKVLNAAYASALSACEGRVKGLVEAAKVIIAKHDEFIAIYRPIVPSPELDAIRTELAAFAQGERGEGK